METIVVEKNDFGWNIAVTMTDSAGSALNLTGYTVTMKLWRPNDPNTVFLTGTCTIDVAASGTCHYTIVDGDFPTARTYEGKFIATATGKQETQKHVRVVVPEGA